MENLKKEFIDIAKKGEKLIAHYNFLVVSTLINYENAIELKFKLEDKNEVYIEDIDKFNSYKDGILSTYKERSNLLKEIGKLDTQIKQQYAEIKKTPSLNFEFDKKVDSVYSEYILVKPIDYALAKKSARENLQSKIHKESLEYLDEQEKNYFAEY
jgi:hypothetical protein